MTIQEFIEALEGEPEIRIQLSGDRSIHPQKPKYMRLDLDERLRSVLKKRGIELFYSHQVMTIDLVRQGENVILMTPTASGKSLVYTIPVLESVINDPSSRSLFLFPLKGLEQDQVKTLNGISVEAGLGTTGFVYDGDTPPLQRKQIREALPNIIFTNPDMLHLAILPFHRKWEDLFRHLTYVVVDEIHSYRGVFGAHVAQVFRRLRRICDHYGSRPQIIAASATIANPSSLAEDLFGLPFRTIDESGAPSPGKHFLFVNPVESPYTMATRLFVRSIEQGFRTIVFTKARKITELIYTWACAGAPGLADRISPYRAGFLPKERREIERKLFSGELLGVVSTSALELGVDIGGLDCCILCGYPGSVSSTWQRAGRVGRQGQESLVLMIAIQDALDQYFMRHPEAFFEKSHEAAVVDPANRHVLRKHLECAAAELGIRPDETVWDPAAVLPAVHELAEQRVLLEGKTGGIWFPKNRRPHRDVSIRAAGERFQLVSETNRLIGELNGGRVFREAFPGAVYLHRGRQYLVSDLDIPKKRVVCTEARVGYYTQAVSSDTTEIIGEKESRKVRGMTMHWGLLRITQKVTGYDRKRASDGVRIATHSLDLPEYVFETEGVWTVIDRRTSAEIESRGFDLGGTLHAVEHTAIACMPLFALCDRGDIGGLSHTGFPAFGLPAIFVYDGHLGGVGLSRRALAIAEDWLAATLQFVSDCPCEDGCPSCTHDPHCGNRNQPLDKRGAIFLLTTWLGE